MRSVPPSDRMQTCSCGAFLPAVEGPVHRYMTSSPSCWEAYGRLLAREYEDRSRWRTHRCSVDAYAAQHPGTESAQTRNSVGIHLSRLCLLFECGWPLERANAAMLAITAKKFAYPWLPPPEHPAGMTAADILSAGDAASHRAAVLGWAEAVWVQWAAHHATVRGWLAAGRPRRTTL